MLFHSKEILVHEAVSVSVVLLDFCGVLNCLQPARCAPLIKSSRMSVHLQQ